METKTVVELNAEIAALDAEIGQAESELHEAEAAADTSAKALDAHGRLASLIVMLKSRKAGLVAEILPAQRVEAAAKVAALKVALDAAFATRATLIEEAKKMIGGWFDYPGGKPYLDYAIAGAKHIREANVKVMELQNRLMGAIRHLQDLPK